ncbi:MAG: GNAT family N-acetyltransferase [Candidatus Kryptoniota bacterium]
MVNGTLKRKIRPFSGEDEIEVVGLWNKCLTRDPITTETFRRKILLDDNFDQDGCLVAEARGKIIGFSLAIRRRYPYYGVGLEQGKGWITAFFVHPDFRNQGIGTTLLSQSEKFLSSCGVKEVYISPYTPNYFIPGVDIDAYREGYEMLKNAGYKKHEKVYSMGRSLLDFEYSQEIEDVCSSLSLRGIEIKLFEPRYITGLIGFINDNYPGDLLRVALEQLRKDTNTDQIIIAVKNGAVVGFSHYEDEHFGPFAIHPAYSGIGIGTCLYYRTALYMKKKGKRNLWLGWTSGHAKDFYYHRGLKVLRRHEILKKLLS